ncbi:TonB-dependent receptor, partial [Acinetobacter baumannii]|uniref:TonB-dependent receptor n=1 Tax=Acinetobacter baumannii TaxID=470 RepID=UPI001EEFFA68
MGTGAPTPDSQGGFTINEAFGEFIVPLIDNAPGVYALSLEAGYRYSDFKTSSNTSDEYGSFKYGINWAPIESLRFRGMFQRANRAPGIGELFAPQVTSLDNLETDPCAGGAISAAPYRGAPPRRRPPPAQGRRWPRREPPGPKAPPTPGGRLGARPGPRTPQTSHGRRGVRALTARAF